MITMILSVYKEKGLTSFDVVKALKNHFKTKKIGHTGTLDPIATGVLICCTDNDTKLVSIITSKEKEYLATIKLGIKTDTGDITGNIIEKKDYNITKDKIEKVLNSFIGDSFQEVPAYSAIKINGKKLYQYARNNENIQLPIRNIKIYEIDLIDFKDDLIVFKVKVSKGTYIRSLINDICSKLNTVGTMLELSRTKQGMFELKSCNKIDDIMKDNYRLISYNDIFKDYLKIVLNDNDYFKVKNGAKMSINSDADQIVFTYKGKYIALYQKDDCIYRIKILIEKS